MPPTDPPRATEERPLDLLVSGHTNLDHFLRVSELPRPDRTVPLSGRSTELGGTAANIARACAGFGVRTGLLSRVGDDFPDAYRAALRRSKIELAGFVTVHGELSPCCYILEDGRGGQMTLIHQGPMGHARGFRVPVDLLAHTHWLHLGTGAPEAQLRLARAAHDAGVRVAIDPAQEIHYLWDRARLSRLFSGAEAFFGNESEVERAVELLGLRRVSDLLERVPLVVMTRGRRGVKAFSRRGEVSVPGVRPRRLVQVTGAGDVFRGGFYAGWFAGQPLEGCLRAGVRAAAGWIENGGDPGRVGSRRKGSGGRPGPWGGP